MIDWFQAVIYIVVASLVGLYGFLYAEIQNVKEELNYAKKNKKEN